MRRRPVLPLVALLVNLVACGDYQLQGLKPILSVKAGTPTDAASHYLLDFGSVYVGSSNDLSLTALNIGRLELTLQPAAVARPFSPDLVTVATLPALGQILVGFGFSPTAAGPAAANVVLKSNGGEVTIDLRANGVPAPPTMRCTIKVDPMPSPPRVLATAISRAAGRRAGA